MVNPPVKPWTSNDYLAATKFMASFLKNDSDALRITLEPFSNTSDVRVTVAAIVDGEEVKRVTGAVNWNTLFTMLFLNSINASNMPSNLDWTRAEIQIFKPEVKVLTQLNTIRRDNPSGLTGVIPKYEDQLRNVRVITIKKDGREDEVPFNPDYIIRLGKREPAEKPKLARV